jgi:hypothetical protein
MLLSLVPLAGASGQLAQAQVAVGDEGAETQLAGQAQGGIEVALARGLVAIDTLRTDSAQEKEN